jgi:cobalt-zinc-cadmium resistance protein CzcA
MTLRDLAEFDVRNRLLAVPGVAAVECWADTSVSSRFSSTRIDSPRGVSRWTVRHALEGANENAAGGFVVQGSTEWAVRAVGRAAGVDDLRQTVVTVRSGTPVLWVTWPRCARTPRSAAGSRTASEGRS